MRLIVRRLVLNIAMSLDGFIARKDGSYDWIEGHQEKQFIVASHTE
ncbi:dihydrofolate reductase family protein [Streptococcus suis]|nr:dihydrofolate reductase family protein [Streptococcus suis]MBY5030172.1 dihydrofolate reductase family protein [Streptococcus suis]